MYTTSTICIQPAQYVYNQHNMYTTSTICIQLVQVEVSIIAVGAHIGVHINVSVQDNSEYLHSNLLLNYEIYRSKLQKKDFSI